MRFAQPRHPRLTAIGMSEINMIHIISLILAASVAIGVANANASSDRLTPLLLIPGPVEFSTEVLAAAGGHPRSHMDKVFASQFGDALRGLRKIAVTDKAQPFIISGSGTLGWDIMASNLLEAGEDVLMVNTGYFGDRYAESIETYGGVVTSVKAPAPGHAPTLASIADALANAPKPFKAITITQVDTSTGVLMDVKSIAALVKRVSPLTLIVVDGVCSFGGESLLFDEWGIDFVLTASQKALGTPPGLSVLIVSPRAIEAIQTRKTPIPNYYGSLLRWLPVMIAYEAGAPKYFATPAVQLVQALKVSIDQILAQGSILSRFENHAATSRRVKDSIEKWGLQLVTASRETEANTMTAILLPKGITAPEFLPKVLNRGVMLAGGLIANISYFRIGHMHITATSPDHIDKVLSVVSEALGDFGFNTQDESARFLSSNKDWKPRQSAAKEEL